jgi:hypothetical protein
MRELVLQANVQRNAMNNHVIHLIKPQNRGTVSPAMEAQSPDSGTVSINDGTVSRNNSTISRNGGTVPRNNGTVSPEKW